MLMSPALRPRVIHTTHRCSGRLFLVHLRHGTDELVIVALYGVSAPKTDDKRFMRAQLAAAMTQVAGEYAGTPMMVVGDLNSAASPDDRGTGELLPYDQVSGALTNVLEMLSFTDVHRHRHKFPPARHYTWSNSKGRKSRIDAVYANAHALEMAGGVDDFLSSIGKTPGPLGTRDRPLTGVCSLSLSSTVATPCNGSLTTVFSPPPAAPARWRLDERGSTSYYDLLLQWSHHEHLSELSQGRAAFRQARTDVYPLAYAASVLELNHSHDEQQVRAAAARASLSSRYTAALYETVRSHSS